MILNIIENNKVRWYEMDKLNSADMEIQNIINQLDKTAVEYEQKWGIGTLQKLCSPDLLEKWMRQCEKFSNAMGEKNVELIRDLASGFKRAYIALESDAVAQGYKPPDLGKSLSYELLNGKKIIVCESQSDLRILTAQHKSKDVTIWTIKEVANFIENHGSLVNAIEKANKKIEMPELDPFDFKKGDSLEFKTTQ